MYYPELDSPLHLVPATPVLERRNFNSDGKSPAFAVVPDYTPGAILDIPSSDSVPGTPITPQRRISSSFSPSIRRRHARLGGSKRQGSEGTPFRTPKVPEKNLCAPSPCDMLVPSTPVQAKSVSRNRLSKSSLKTLHLVPESPCAHYSTTMSTEIDTTGDHVTHVHAEEGVKHVRIRLNPQSTGYGEGMERQSRNGKPASKRRAVAAFRKSPKAFGRRCGSNESPDLLDLI